MSSFSQKIFTRPLFLKFYEKYVYSRFLTRYAREKTTYESVYEYLDSLAPDVPCGSGTGKSRLFVDVGCGTGWFTRRLAVGRAGSADRIVGIDVSAQALDKARELTACLPEPHAKLTFITANAQDLVQHVPPRSADEVWICGSLHQMEDPSAVLHQVCHILLPHARVYCQTFCENPGNVSGAEVKVLGRFGHRVFTRAEWGALVLAAGLETVAERQSGLVLFAVLREASAAAA